MNVYSMTDYYPPKNRVAPTSKLHGYVHLFYPPRDVNLLRGASTDVTSVIEEEDAP